MGPRRGLRASSRQSSGKCRTLDALPPAGPDLEPHACNYRGECAREIHDGRPRPCVGKSLSACHWLDVARDVPHGRHASVGASPAAVDAVMLPASVTATGSGPAHCSLRSICTQEAAALEVVDEVTPNL